MATVGMGIARMAMVGKVMLGKVMLGKVMRGIATAVRHLGVLLPPRRGAAAVARTPERRVAVGGGDDVLDC